MIQQVWSWCSASVSLSICMNWRWISPLARRKLTRFITTLTTFSSFNTLLHRASWWVIQWRNINSSEFLILLCLVIFLVGQCFYRLDLVIYLLWHFSVCSLVDTFFSKLADILSYKSEPLVVPIIHSIARSSSYFKFLIYSFDKNVKLRGVWCQYSHLVL